MKATFQKVEILHPPPGVVQKKIMNDEDFEKDKKNCLKNKNKKKLKKENKEKENEGKKLHLKNNELKWM